MEETMMSTSVLEVMTPRPMSLPHTATIVEAARLMRDAGVGDVVVTDNGIVRGIVTDRDIVVRSIADAEDPSVATLATICSASLIAVAPTDTADHAAQIMRDQALRRLPVIEQRKLVGIVSLGDLAIELTPESALADISSAPANT
jgi:CBS domain-containing protein